MWVCLGRENISYNRKDTVSYNKILFQCYFALLMMKVNYFKMMLQFSCNKPKIKKDGLGQGWGCRCSAN